jgi:hypothetical protein
MYHAVYSPPSSPPSSPALSLWEDSSPPASPIITELSNMDSIRADPLAGSYFSNRNKRPVTCDPRGSPSKRARHRDSVGSDAEEPTVTTIDLAQSAEDEIWEAAGTNAYESGKLKIDLGYIFFATSVSCDLPRSCHTRGRHLTKIPPQFVLDLKSIVVLRDAPGLYDDENYPGRVSSTVKAGLAAGRRPLTRVYTAPITTSRDVPRSFNDRSHSMANVSVMNSMTQDRAELFLSNNKISKLPLELWSLHNLAILALRMFCCFHLIFTHISHSRKQWSHLPSSGNSTT